MSGASGFYITMYGSFFPVQCRSGKREGRRIARANATGAQRRRRGYVLLAPSTPLVAPVLQLLCRICSLEIIIIYHLAQYHFG